MLPRNDKIGVGSRVKIIRGTYFAYQNDGIGTVIELRVAGYPFRVTWDKQVAGEYITNNYRVEDLEHVTKE